MASTTSGPAPLPSLEILIVEDYADLRDMLAEFLSLSGFHVQQAGDGQAALDLIDQNKYDAILLDMALPRLDGWQLLTLLQQRHPGLPVVVCTAHATAAVAEYAQTAGAYAFLTKPADFDVIAATLREAASSSQKKPVAGSRTPQPSPPVTRPDSLTRALAEIVGGTCHDLANSLAFVAGCADVQRPTDGTQAIRRVVRGMTSQVLELHGFVRLFYQTDADDIEQVPCSRLKQSIVAALPAAVDARCVNVRVRCESTDVWLPSILLRLLVGPLVANSWEAAQQQGLDRRVKIAVSVHVLPRREGLIVRVTDNGPGFGSVLPEVTQAASEGRAFSTKDGTRGYGLLHLARLVRRLQGRVEISNGTVGALVQVQLPLEDK